MEYHFRIFCVILRIMGIIGNVLCITEEEIIKIVERKMEKIIKKYDRKIALLQEKIHAQDVKFQNLEKKCSTPTKNAIEKGEEKSIQPNVSTGGNNTGMQSKRLASSRHANVERIAEGSVR